MRLCGMSRGLRGRQMRLCGVSRGLRGTQMKACGMSRVMRGNYAEYAVYAVWLACVLVIIFCCIRSCFTAFGGGGGDSAFNRGNAVVWN
jgi:hypothetical protein